MQFTCFWDTNQGLAQLKQHQWRYDEASCAPSTSRIQLGARPSVGLEEHSSVPCSHSSSCTGHTLVHTTTGAWMLKTSPEVLWPSRRLSVQHWGGSTLVSKGLIPGEGKPLQSAMPLYAVVLLRPSAVSLIQIVRDLKTHFLFFLLTWLLGFQSTVHSQIPALIFHYKKPALLFVSKCILYNKWKLRFSTTAS